jgi:hypothetical protein
MRRQNKAIRDHGNKYIAHLDFDLLAGVCRSASANSASFSAAANETFAEEAELMTKQADSLVGPPQSFFALGLISRSRKRSCVPFGLTLITEDDRKTRHSRRRP